jgi:hypothetical protein
MDENDPRALHASVTAAWGFDPCDHFSPEEFSIEADGLHFNMGAIGALAEAGDPRAQLLHAALGMFRELS